MSGHCDARRTEEVARCDRAPEPAALHIGDRQLAELVALVGGDVASVVEHVERQEKADRSERDNAVEGPEQAKKAEEDGRVEAELLNLES